MRDETRARKRNGYLEAARCILMRDGFDALTMQAIATEVGAAVGTIYGYFPSKGALVAELQVHAIETVVGAWHTTWREWARALSAEGLDDAELSVAGMLAFGEFFLAIQDEFELEFALNRLHLESAREIFDGVDLAVLRPSARSMLEGPGELLRDGIASGAFRDEADLVDVRSMSLWLGLYGVSLLSEAHRNAAPLFVPLLTRRTVVDATIAYGADVATVERLEGIVRGVTEARPLHAIDLDRPMASAGLSETSAPD